MSRKLDDLSERMRPMAMAFLARLIEAKIPVLIVDTLRTRAEHETNLANGRSWAKISNHLDGRLYRNTVSGSDAMDVVPYSVYDVQGPDKLLWDADDPVWAKIGYHAERVGLVWGGRWRVRDLGHVEHPNARDGLRETSESDEPQEA